MSLNLAEPLYAALVGVSSITDLLGTFNGEPSVHTKRPIPEVAGFPLIAVSPDITLTDVDGVKDSRPVVVKDISVYGEAQNHYRDVENIAYLVRTLFHRQQQSIEVDGYNVVLITASGPRIAPTDDDTTVGRIVSLTIRLAA